MEKMTSIKEFEQVTKLTVAFFGILYIIGLIVTQIHLGSFGISDFDMVQYI